MKGGYLGALALVAFISGNFAASSAGRTINDIPGAREALRTAVSSKLYRSLLISPVEACITARGELAKDHLLGSRIIHSGLDGRDDSLALELAGNLQILDFTESDPAGPPRRVLVNLLIFQIADGKMALSFALFDEAGGSQFRYSGAAWMAVMTAGKWVTIDPLRLSPHERRGPRMYTLAVEKPGSARSVFGNGRLPIATISIQGGQGSPTHVSGSR